MDNSKENAEVIRGHKILKDYEIFHNFESHEISNRLYANVHGDLKTKRIKRNRKLDN